jgi:hypothetical protein
VVERAAVRTRVDAWEGHSCHAHADHAGVSEHEHANERQHLAQVDCAQLRQPNDVMLPDSNGAAERPKNLTHTDVDERSMDQHVVVVLAIESVRMV